MSHDTQKRTDYYPPFSTLAPDTITTLVEQALAQASEDLTHITQTHYATPEAFLEAVNAISTNLGKIWGPLEHLFMVDNPRWQAIYQSLLPQIVQFWNRFHHNEALYEQYKHHHAQPGLRSETERALRLQKQAFEHTGIGLPEAEKHACGEDIERIATLQTQFAQHHLQCKDHFCHWIQDPHELRGLPNTFIDNAKQKACDAGRPDDWLIGIDDRSIEIILKHAQHRPLRASIHEAYLTQASPRFIAQYHGEPQWDNTPIVNELLAIRQQLAARLGYPHYAALTLSTRMASDTDTVQTFLSELTRHARPKAEAERAALYQFAQETLGMSAVEPYDIRYVSERMKEALFNITEEEIRPYFPCHAVLAGLNKLCESLFHITIKKVSTAVPTWHPYVDVQAIYDLDTGEHIGYLYVDFITRKGKSSGAWMNEACTTLAEKPIAYLTCNFSEPTADCPTLLSHQDILTLAHELGHCLNHLLNRTQEWSLVGNRGMEWDAVELQSQFMENFCWDKTILIGMSQHYQTGEPLPETLYEKLCAARHFMTGTAMLRQIEFARFDMGVHLQPDGRSVFEHLAAIRQETTVFPAASYDHFPLFFDHIFAGGYAAGYYGYHWAEQLSSDVFSAFEEEGLADIRQTQQGPALRHHLYECSGGQPTMACFTAFRGRTPNMDALLRHRGLSTSSSVRPTSQASGETVIQ